MTLLLASVTTASAAQLWDLVVSAKAEKTQININERPVIFGTVLNHAMKPVSDADVRISFANISVNTKTDFDGNFRHEFANQTVSGLFSVNVYVKSGSMIGIAKTSIKIGQERPTFDEVYYKSSLYERAQLPNGYDKLEQKQYQKFVEQQNLQKQKQAEIELKMMYLQKQKSVAQQRLEDALKEKPVGAGILSDKDQKEYLAKVDPRIRTAISAQLNYTKQLFADAQNAMKEVLDNGGSLQDAKKAYFEKLTVTKNELVNVVDINSTENHSKVKTSEDKKINSKKVKGLTYNKNLK
jgi:hypothetical protein